MPFISHIISSDGVEVDPKKIVAVKIFPSTLTPTDISSFLGLAGYYMCFLDGFTSIVFFLSTLTQKSVKYKLSEVCEISFKI